MPNFDVPMRHYEDYCFSVVADNEDSAIELADKLYVTANEDGNLDTYKVNEDVVVLEDDIQMMDDDE